MAVRSSNIVAARGMALLAPILEFTILLTCTSCRRCDSHLSRTAGYGQDDSKRKGGDDYHK